MAETRDFPVGCRVTLVTTGDPLTDLAPGIGGEVMFIDDAGTIHVRWDNGSTLGVIIGPDEIERAERSSVQQ